LKYCGSHGHFLGQGYGQGYGHSHTHSTIHKNENGHVTVPSDTLSPRFGLGTVTGSAAEVRTGPFCLSKLTVTVTVTW
jgi:hypothetical protein